MYLRSDNGPKFVSNAVLRWLKETGIETALIDPGKPWQDSADESVNGKFRDECLNLEWFRNRTAPPVGQNCFGVDIPRRCVHALQAPWVAGDVLREEFEEPSDRRILVAGCCGRLEGARGAGLSAGLRSCPARHAWPVTFIPEATRSSG